LHEDFTSADVPANTQVAVWTGSGFQTATKRSSGAWTGDGAAATLAPGAGFFLKNAGTTDMTVTFAGEVTQGNNLTVAFPAGFSLLGSIVPQAGKVQTDLGLPAQANDQVFLFKAGNYTTLTKRSSGAWTGGTGEPEIGVAEGFFYKAVAAGSWTRNFSVNTQ
jgi:hypothetical protein